MIFETWDGYVLACPDLKDDENLYFEGDVSSMFSRSIGVKFEKCHGDGCKNNIDDWLMDVQVDMWVIEDMID